MRRLYNSPWLTLINALLCVAAISVNAHYQLFCRPVTWAWVALVVCIIPVVLYPLFKERSKRFRTPLFFVFGCAACICIYCILFLGFMNLIIPLVTLSNPVAILGYLPLFLLIQILYFSRRTEGSLKPFLSGVLICVACSVGMATWFHRSFERVNAALNDPHKAALVPPNYMTELMLGMHFKYHISFCAFDGWRPPLHDPSIVVAAWLNVPFQPDPFKRDYHYQFICTPPLFVGLRTGLAQRIEVYRRVFPNNAIQQSCSCAKEYSKMYMDHPVFR